MATNGIDVQVSSTTEPQRRMAWVVSGIALRLLIAFVISWMIVLAFFVSGVVSH